VNVQLREQVDGFERRLLRRGLSPSTARAYRWALDLWVQWLDEQGVGEPAQISRGHVERWQDQLIARNLSPRTRGLAATALREFLKHMVWADVEINPRLPDLVERPRVQRLQPRPIPRDDLELLRLYLLQRPPRMQLAQLRNRALFFYLLTTSGRVSEVLQVTRDDWRRAVIRQKGGSEKTLLAVPHVEAMLEDYLACRNDELPWLWVTHQPNHPQRRLDPAGVREAWMRIAARVGIPAFTTHQIRHTSASILLRSRVPVATAASYLGHQGLQSIMGYAEIGDDMRDEAAGVLDEFVGELEVNASRRRPVFRRMRRAS
jgi:integrase/recombinase XerD